MSHHLFRILLWPHGGRRRALILAWLAVQLASNAAVVSPTNSSLNLLPWPKSVELASGEIKITGRSRIVAGNPGLKPLAPILRDELRLVTGLNLVVVDGPPRPGDVVLRINQQLQAGEDILCVRRGEVVRTRDGAYRLQATDGVVIEGFDYRAVAEGTATLLQAVRRVGDFAALPAMTINDWPHADFTGVMLDVARQANTLEEIRRCVLVCRAYKIRYLQLHLTDDQAWTFPSTAYPALGTRNGSAHGGPAAPRYDLAELKALVKFADERGVTLVPELEVPGHSGNACGTLPEIFGYLDPVTKKPVGQGMMNIAQPKLYEALDTIIGEMCAVFASSPYVHIGCDEVSGLGNVASTPGALAFMKEKKMQSPGELLNHFIAEVNAMVKKRGRKTIIWEGAANGVAKDIINMTWDGNARTAERLVAQGITTITVPWNLAGVPWNEWSMYHCNGSVLKKGNPVLGAMLPVWEQKGEVSLRWLRGGLPRRQERVWGPDTVIETNNFSLRVNATDFVLDRLLYGFAIDQSPSTEEGLTHRRITGPTVLKLSAWPGLGTVRSTRDGSEPTIESPGLGEPFMVADNFTIKARLYDEQGHAAASIWSQPYIFAPLSLHPEGLLTNSTWFSDTVTLKISSTIKSGTIRFTLDGSVPHAASPACDNPLRFTSTTRINARWFDDGNTGRGETVAATYQKLTTVRHAAVNKPVTISVTAKLEAAAAARLLVDGVLTRGGQWGTPEVLALSSSDLEAVIDLEVKTEIRKVVARCLHCQEAGIYPARQVAIFVSDDGLNFTPAGAAEYKVPGTRGADGSSVKEIVVESTADGRYLKVVCKNNGPLPAWHNAPGVPGHLMLDEILVNPSAATN